jgi:hypothetical protein
VLLLCCKLLLVMPNMKGFWDTHPERPLPKKQLFHHVSQFPTRAGVLAQRVAHWALALQTSWDGKLTSSPDLSYPGWKLWLWEVLVKLTTVCLQFPRAPDLQCPERTGCISPLTIALQTLEKQGPVLCSCPGQPGILSRVI